MVSQEVQNFLILDLHLPWNHLEPTGLWVLDDSKVDEDLKLGNFVLPVKPNHAAKANMIVYGVCAGTHPEFGNIAFITEDEGSRVQMWAHI